MVESFTTGVMLEGLQCQDQLVYQKQGAPELIEMQKGFVGLAQGKMGNDCPSPRFR
jgi:hypothetical protein